jgi:hypothetical protein
MIKIIKEKTKNKKAKEPYYTLKYEYMIGDANGSTNEKVRLSVDNPFIEIYVTALNKLKPTPGHWGVMLESEGLYEHFEQKQITKEEYKILSFVIGCDEDDEDEEDEEGEKLEYTDEEMAFLHEFEEGVRAVTEYSFLVFEGAELTYTDEFGEKSNTKFV